MLALVAVFQLATAPVAAQMVGRAAYRSGRVDRALLDTDELAGPLTGRNRTTARHLQRASSQRR